MSSFLEIDFVIKIHAKRSRRFDLLACIFITKFFFFFHGSNSYVDAFYLLLVFFPFIFIKSWSVEQVWRRIIFVRKKEEI